MPSSTPSSVNLVEECCNWGLPQARLLPRAQWKNAATVAWLSSSTRQVAGHPGAERRRKMDDVTVMETETWSLLSTVAVTLTMAVTVTVRE